MSAVKAFYDHYWTEGFSPSGQTLNQAISRLLDELAGSVIVDVRRGDASHAGAWAKANHRAYRGFDVSEAAVALSVKQGYQAEVIQDATRLPLEDASVDTVLCMEVLEHLFLPNAAVLEMHRVIKPGGALIVTVPNVVHWRNRVDIALFGRWHPGGDNLSVDQPWRDPHMRFFTPNTLARMLQECGMTVLRVDALPEHVFGRMPGLRRFAKAPGRVSAALCKAYPAMFGTQIVAACRRAA